MTRADVKLPAFRGLTWDHPRGYNALARAAVDAEGLTLQWDRQSLEGFESAPIGELCDRYDLVVLDHPHVGEAVAADCLIPVEDLFGADEIAGWLEESGLGPANVTTLEPDDPAAARTVLIWTAEKRVAASTAAGLTAQSTEPVQ